MNNSIKRVGIVFSGGPAPAANAVISAAALAFLDVGVEVIGFLDGWEHLNKFGPANPLIGGSHFRILTRSDVSHIRNEGSIIIRTSRSNPGKSIGSPADLLDSKKTADLQTVLAALASLEIDALITIGGDDTLRTANHLHTVLATLPDRKPIGFIHLPKTIDNDYGVDFSFGFMTAADHLSKQVHNIRADAQSSSAWYVLEVMGRQAGWLTYAAGIAGAATRMYSVEDFDGVFDVDAVAEEIVELMLLRAEHGKRYGVVCVAEGLAALLPVDQLPRSTDPLGNIRLGEAIVCRILGDAIEAKYLEITGDRVKIRSKQLGYEARCAPPNAFDILLGSQLGTGAARALLEENLDAVMVSVEGQFQLKYVPFTDLIDKETLKTKVRFVERGSDFYRLARSMEDRKRR